MHLIERYSLNTGAKIHKPYVCEHYFPFHVDKYVVFQPATDNPLKKYDYWQEVLNILVPILQKNDIQVCLLGNVDPKNKKAKASLNYGGTYNLINQTSRPNVAYLIKNSLLYLGGDTFGAQFAGHYDKKSVVLYSHVNKNNRRPYWGSEENQILLEPDRKGRKPFYHSGDSFGDASRICPYLIVESVCNLLGIPFNRNYKTIWTGEGFQKRIIDFVPDRNLADYKTKLPIIRARMDLNFNVENLVNSFAPIESAVSIVTDRPIPVEALKILGKKVKEIFYILKSKNIDQLNEKYVTQITKFCSTHFISFEDEESQGLFKMKFMDCMFVTSQTIPKKEDIITEEHSEKQLFYKPAKLILSNGKVYPNLHAYKSDNPIEAIQDVILPIEDSKDFWEEAPFYSILEKID